MIISYVKAIPCKELEASCGGILLFCYYKSNLFLTLYWKYPFIIAVVLLFLKGVCVWCIIFYNADKPEANEVNPKSRPGRSLKSGVVFAYSWKNRSNEWRDDILSSPAVAYKAGHCKSGMTNYRIGQHWTLVAYPARGFLGLGARVCASFRSHLRKFVRPWV